METALKGFTVSKEYYSWILFPKTNYWALLNFFQFLLKSLITFWEKDPKATISIMKNIKIIHTITEKETEENISSVSVPFI